MTINPQIAIAISAYLALMLVIGLVCKRFVKNDADFMLAGRNLGTGLIAVTLVAANFGGAFILGTSQDATQVGMAAIAFALGIFLGLCVLGLFVAGPMRRSGASTVPGFLENRYKSRTVKNLATVLSVAGLTGILAGQISAASSVFGSFGIGPVWAGLISVALIIGYTAISGMWGIAITDLIQVALIVIGVLVVFALALQEAGGMAPVLDHMRQIGVEQPLNPLNQGWSFFLGGSLPIVAYKLIGQDILQRVFSSKNVHAARNGAIIAGVGTAIFAVVPALTGMAAVTIFPNMDPEAGAIPTLVQEVLPPWIAGVLIAALLAAVMSTANALLLAATSNVSTDLYRQWRGYKPEKQLLVSRISAVALGLIAYALAMTGAGILQILTYAFTMYGSGVFVAVIVGMFWKRGTAFAAVSSILVGATIGALGVTQILPDLFVPTIVIAVLLSGIVYVVVSLFDTTKNHSVPEHPQSARPSA